MVNNENLSDRKRQRFYVIPNIEEKEMMGGLAFMCNNKMCACEVKDELM